MLPPAPPPGGVSEFTRDGKELLMAFGALIIGWIVFNVVNGPVGQVFDKAASALNWMLSNPFGWIVGIFVFLLFKSETFREKFFGFWGDTFKGVKRRIFSERNWFNSRSYEQNEEDLNERTEGAKNNAEARDLHEEQNEEWEKTLKAEGSGANTSDVETLEEFRKNYETQAMPADNKNYKDGQTNADVLDQRDGLKPHQRMKSVADRNIETLNADSEKYASDIEYWKGVSTNCEAVETVLKKSGNESFVKSFEDVIEATRIDATASHFEIIKASMKKIERQVKSGNYATSEEAFNDLRLNLPTEFADMQKAGVLGEADKVLPSFTKNGREVTGFKPGGMDPLKFNGEPLSATTNDGKDIFSIVETNIKNPTLKPPLTGLSTTNPDLWKNVSGEGLPIPAKMVNEYPTDSLAAVEAERSKTLQLEGAAESAGGAEKDVAAATEEALEER